MDILVTTPKTEVINSQREANELIQAGGGEYFRRLNTRPKNLKPGDKIFYTENGFVRGYAVVKEIRTDQMQCSTTGKHFAAGIYLIMDANSWKWIKPIAYPGFQGWRYFDAQIAKPEVIGGWLDPKP